MKIDDGFNSDRKLNLQLVDQNSTNSHKNFNLDRKNSKQNHDIDGSPTVSSI